MTIVMPGRGPKQAAANSDSAFDHELFLQKFLAKQLSLADLQVAAASSGVQVPTVNAAGELRMKKSVYLDNAATTPILKPANDYALYLENQYRSNIGRSYGYQETVMRVACNLVRTEAAKWYGARKTDLPVLGTNVTALLQMTIEYIAAKMPKAQFLLSPMSHSALSIPIHHLAQGRYEHLAITPMLDYDIEALRSQLERCAQAGQPAVIAIETVSNLTGYESNWAEVLALADEFKARVVIDNAQGANFIDLKLSDYSCPIHLGISGHKMGARDGSAILIGSADVFMGKTPLRPTGGMIHNYTRDREFYMRAPWSLEGGTQNFVAQASLAAAFRILSRVGKASIKQAFAENSAYLESILSTVEHVKVLGAPERKARYGAIPFLMYTPDGKEVPSMAVAACLSYFHGIQVRANHHCTPVLIQELKGIANDDANTLSELTLKYLGQPYQASSHELTQHLAEPCDPLSALHTVRASVSYSTTQDDMDALAHALRTISAERQYEQLTVRCNPFLGVSEYLPQLSDERTLQALMQPACRYEDLMTTALS